MDYHRASTGTRFIGGNNFNIATQSFTNLDSPSTTSAITTMVGVTMQIIHINSNGEILVDILVLYFTWDVTEWR